MLGEYIASIFETMEGKMSGICSLVLTIAASYTTFFSGSAGAERVKAYLWIAAGLTFLFANYTAWRREHLKVISQSPSISMAIEQVRWELFGQNKTALVFAVTLLNSGAPSITRGWHGSIRIGNGNEEKLESFVATGPWIIQQDGQSVTIHPEDSIVAKTLERRLETGEAKVGRIFFALPGDRISQLVTANFDATLGCYDFKGKLVKGKFVPHGAPLIGVQIFPGEKGSASPAHESAAHAPLPPPALEP